jgi:hypothetical protein
MKRFCLGLLALTLGTSSFAATWTPPRTWLPNELVTASMMNTHVRDNLTVLYDSQASFTGFFRGVVLRTHVDTDLAKKSVMLLNANQITMDDGTGVSDWGSNLSCDITTVGAGGLDTGSEIAFNWYQIYAIRKSSDGTKNLLLHKATKWVLDEEQNTADSTQNFRETSSLQKIAQGFSVDETAPIISVYVPMRKVGSPTGTVWMTLEADSAGSPSGTPLATSQKIDASLLVPSSGAAGAVVFVFRNPLTATLGTTYHMVLNSSVTTSASHYVDMSIWNANVYAKGALKTYDGAAWTAAVKDLTFQLIIQRIPTAVTMPSGYDQKALIGYVYNNSASDFVPFIAADRYVTPLTQQVVGSAMPYQLPITMGITELLPPTLTKSYWWVYLEAATAARNIVIAPGETGYINSFNDREGGQARMLVSVVGSQVIGPVINSASPWLLFHISGDTVTIIADSWEWQ